MHESQPTDPNPYSSPRESGASNYAAPVWRTSALALLCLILPCALTWIVLESPLTRVLEAPPDSVQTPNPQKAPYPFVTQTQEIMMWTNPRLAIFAHRW